MECANVIMIHAAPWSLRIDVRDESGASVAFVDRLTRRVAYCPITRVRRQGNTFTREDEWPRSEDLGRPLLLPGGEVGILRQRSNAGDGSDWRWTVGLYNRA